MPIPECEPKVSTTFLARRNASARPVNHATQLALPLFMGMCLLLTALPRSVPGQQSDDRPPMGLSPSERELDPEIGIPDQRRAVRSGQFQSSDARKRNPKLANDQPATAKNSDRQPLRSTPRSAPGQQFDVRPAMGLSPSERELDPEIGVPDPRRAAGNAQYHSSDARKSNLKRSNDRPEPGDNSDRKTLMANSNSSSGPQSDSRPAMGLSPSERELDPEIGIPDPRRAVGRSRYQSSETSSRNLKLSNNRPVPANDSDREPLTTTFHSVPGQQTDVRPAMGLSPSEREVDPEISIPDPRQVAKSAQYRSSEIVNRNLKPSNDQPAPANNIDRQPLMATSHSVPGQHTDVRPAMGLSPSERELDPEIGIPDPRRAAKNAHYQSFEGLSRNLKLASDQSAPATSSDLQPLTALPRSDPGQQSEGRAPMGLSPSERELDPEIGIPDPRRAAGSAQYQSFDVLSRNLKLSNNQSAPADNSDLQPLTDLLPLEFRPREMTLREAIQASLMKSDTVRTLGSSGVQVESVTPLDPAILRAKSDVTATVFDPKLTAGYLGSRINEPTGTFFGPGIPQETRRDEGNLTASLSKLWATGGTTTIGYLPPLGYLFYPNGVSDGFNPIFTSDLVATATQPLMRGAGPVVALAPIRIAQLKAEQSAWDVKQALLAQVRSVESAYWDLQAALVTLNATESVVPFMAEIVRIEELRAQTELSTRADVARASLQYDTLRQQQIQARNDALGKELRLRNLLALELSDGTRIVPIDLPRGTPVSLNHAGTVANAVEYSPDLVKQRLGVRIREFEYAIARNGLKPQLDLQALYRSNGIGQTLGPSLQQMLGFSYSDWTLGATFSIPLGNRAAKANMMAAEFQLTRDRAVLAQSIQNISYSLADMIRETTTAFNQYQLAVRRARNSREWIAAAKLRYSVPPPAADGTQNWMLLALYDYQNALRMHVDATNDAGQLLAKYNTQLAKLEEAQGTLLETRGIELDDDPCLEVRKHAEKLFAPDRVFETDAARLSATAISSTERSTLNRTSSQIAKSQSSTNQETGQNESVPRVDMPQPNLPISNPQYPPLTDRRPQFVPPTSEPSVRPRPSEILQASHQVEMPPKSARAVELPPAGHSLEAQQIAKGTRRPTNFSTVRSRSQTSNNERKP